MNDIVLMRRELNVLLSVLSDLGRKYCGVTYPFFDLQLFRLDLERPAISKIVQFEQFDTVRHRHKPYGKEVTGTDLPVYNDLRNCFLSSRVERYRNDESVMGRLRELREEMRDPNKRPRPLFIALDTNVLYARFLSRHLPFYDESGRPILRAEEFRYVLSEMVQQEIDFQVRDKYSGDHIRELKKSFSNAKYLDEFYNASMRRTRLAKMALSEMAFVTAALRAMRVKGSLKTSEAGTNDIQIAQSYKEYSRRMDCEVLMLTADEDMIFHANNAELMAIQIILPNGPPSEGRVDPWSIQDLLYDLAVTLGVIELSEPGVAIMGEWGGKSSEDYSSEMVKLRMDDSDLFSAMERELLLSRRVRELYESS